MEILRRYYLRGLAGLLLLVFVSCDRLSNEDFRELSADERRHLSAEYTQLAKRLESGSPLNMELLEKAIRINPQNDLAWRELSLPYLHAGMYNEWNDYIVKAIELNPEAWQAWRGYDRLFYFRDYAGALFDLDASETLTKNQVDYPQNLSVDYLRGLCYFGLKDYPLAIEYFEKHTKEEALNVGEPYIDEAVFVYLGLIEIRLGRFDNALEYFDRGLKYEDSFADFHYHKARVYCYMDQIDLAWDEIETAIKKFDDGNYMHGWRFETLAQIYRSDLESLKAQIEERISEETS